MANPTLTDAILLAIHRDLEGRRAELDGDRGLRSITLLVHINERTRQPRRVVFRKECEGSDMKGENR